MEEVEEVSTEDKKCNKWQMSSGEETEGSHHHQILCIEEEGKDQ